MNPTNGGWLILLTLLGAMVLTVAYLPASVPDWLRWLRPDWALAVFFFWSVAAPERTGMISAWFAGLFFDALLGTTCPLGLHGLGFAFAVFVAARFQDRLRAYTVIQQAAVVCALAAIVHVFKGLVRTVAYDVDVTLLVPVPALTTMLVYPLLVRFLGPLAERLVGR